MKVESCGFGVLLQILADGRICPCHSHDHVLGNVRKQGFQTAIKELEFLHKSTMVDNIEECKACDLKYICAGGCKVDNLDRYGHYTKFKCSKDYKEAYYRMLVANS